MLRFKKINIGHNKNWSTWRPPKSCKPCLAKTKSVQKCSKFVAIECTISVGRTIACITCVGLFAQMESHDTDERNMAVRDLSATLEEYEGTLDSDIQDKWV